MASLPITTILAGVAAVALVLLSFPIANHRRKNQLGAGDGGDAKFNAMIRAQANFAEYTPLALIVIGLLEMNSFAPLWIWVLGGTFAVGRLLHVVGMVAGALPARAFGMILTFGTLLCGGAMLLWCSFAG